MRIIVNGKGHKVQKANLSYEDICVLALGQVKRYLTIVYHKGGQPDKRSGSVYQGGPEMIATEGTVISAMFTGNA